MISTDHLKRFFRSILRISLWSSTAIVLVASFMVVRLIYAPINLDFARNTIIDQISEFLPGWEMSFGAAEIGWDYAGVRPWVHLQDVTLVDRRQRLTADLASARVVVSLGSLISGLNISTIEVDKAVVNITDLGGFSDATDNSLFSDLFAGGGIPRPEVFRPVTEAFSRFSARLLQNAPGLETVEFSNSKVDITRGEGLSPLVFGMQKLRLTHLAEILQVSAQVDTSLADVPTRFRLDGSAEPAAGTLAVTLIFNDLSPSSLAEKMNLPEFFSYFKLPIGLDLRLEMTSALGLEKAAFDVAIGQGVLSDPVVYPERSEINYGIVSASYNVAEKLLTIDDLELGLGSALVRGTGLAFWEDASETPGVRLALTADNATIEDVKKYWPVQTNPDGSVRGARAWIDQNMIAGFARNIRFDVTRDPDGATPYANNSVFELLFDFEDVDTRYLKDMPPIMNAAGRAVLTREVFDVFLDSGIVEDMPIAGSRAHMYDIHMRGKGIGEFDLALKGPVYDVMTLIAHPPVRIRNLVKVDLERFSGNADIHAKITTPLVKGVPRDSIQYEVSAQIEQGGFTDLLGGSGLANAALLLELDKDLLTASGKGTLNEVPLDLYWREDFKAGRTASDAETTNLVLSGMIDEKGLGALGVDISDYLAGPVRSEATFLGRNLKINRGYFSADASGALLKVPQLAWQKDAVSPANINGSVFFENGGSRLDALKVTGEDINLTADIAWNGKATGIYEGQFSIAQLGKNKLQATIVGEEAGKTSVVITAETFDLGPLITREEPVLASEDPALANAGIPVNAEISLMLNAGELLLLNGESLADVKAVLFFANDEPKRLALSGRDRNGLTHITIDTGDDPLQPLLVESADAGGLLRGLGFFAHVEGGVLGLEGETNGWGDALEVLGTLRVRDARLVAKETLGPHITEGVISGLDDYLEDGPLPLDVVDMPFGFQDGLLDISSMKANGPSLGMTMEGQIETRQSKINVNGVVVPAYGLNSLLGKIPLVGGIFSGGEGKGLFGVSYRVKGSTEEPNISVNALSGLAPGFLRLLFEGRKGTVDSIESAQEPAVPETGEQPPLGKEEQPTEPPKPAEAEEPEPDPMGNENNGGVGEPAP